MQDITRELSSITESAAASLLKLTEAESELRTAEGRWSRKEILGHLIDSASNNHQRFVRAQLTDDLSLPGYEQKAWVESQSYQTAGWPGLVELWRAYNLHLAHLIAHIPEAKLSHRVTVGQAQPVTLEFLIRDYLRHLKHHLAQLLN